VRHVDQNAHREFRESLPLYPGAPSVQLTKRIYNWKQDPARIEQLRHHEQNMQSKFSEVVNDTIVQLVQKDLGWGTRSLFDRVSIQAESPALLRAFDPIARGDAPVYDRVILDDHGHQHGLCNWPDLDWVTCNDGHVEKAPDGTPRRCTSFLNRSIYIKTQTDIHNVIRRETDDKKRRGFQNIENPHTKDWLNKHPNSREASANFFGERDRRMRIANGEIGAYLLATQGLGVPMDNQADEAFHETARMDELEDVWAVLDRRTCHRDPYARNNYTSDAHGWIPLTEMALSEDWADRVRVYREDRDGIPIFGWEPLHHLLAIVSSNRYQVRLVIPAFLGAWVSFAEACSKGQWYIRSVCGQSFCPPPGIPFSALSNDVRDSLLSMEGAVHWVAPKKMAQFSRTGQVRREDRGPPAGRYGITFATVIPTMPGWNGDNGDSGKIEEWWLRIEMTQLRDGYNGVTGVVAPLTRAVTLDVEHIDLNDLDCIHVSEDCHYTDGKYLGIALRDVTSGNFKAFIRPAAECFPFICAVAGTKENYDKLIVCTRQGPTVPKSRAEAFIMAPWERSYGRPGDAGHLMPLWPGPRGTRPERGDHLPMNELWKEWTLRHLADFEKDGDRLVAEEVITRKHDPWSGFQGGLAAAAAQDQASRQAQGGKKGDRKGGKKDGNKGADRSGKGPPDNSTTAAVAQAMNTVGGTGQKHTPAKRSGSPAKASRPFWGEPLPASEVKHDEFHVEEIEMIRMHHLPGGASTPFEDVDEFFEDDHQDPLINLKIRRGRVEYDREDPPAEQFMIEKREIDDPEVRNPIMLSS